MPGNLNDKDQHFSSGGHSLPLQDFFINLKLNGFLVTPEQIADANRIINHYASQVSNEAELCHYLSPLFVRDAEEQSQFTDIFTTHFISGRELPVDNNTRWLKKHLIKSWWKYLSGIIILAILSFIYFCNKNTTGPPAYLPDIYLYDKNDASKRADGKRAFQLTINEKLEVYPLTGYGLKDSSHPLSLSTKYSWGDQSPIDTVSSHIYTAQGRFKLMAYVRVFYNNVFKQVDTVTQEVLVCGFNNRLTILNPGNNDSIRVGKKITLEAIIDGQKPDSIRWGTDERTLGYGNTYTATFDSEGAQAIYCLAIYDSALSSCTIQKNLNIIVYDPDKPVLKVSFNKSDNAKLIRIPVKVKPSWFYFMGGFSLLSLALVALLAWKKNWKKNDIKKNTDSIQEKFDTLLFSFSGKKYPAELPFQNKNYLPVPEPEINEAATRMRRRINNAAFFLQIQKTIEKAIKNLGFFQPVYQPRLQQSEYLVLIDASHNNNQQVKLFDYLVDILKKQNVFIEKYYYRYEPNLCYNSAAPAGISLEKLSEKYDKNILLIFGNAYQLLYQFYPVFNNEYLQLLNRWQYKAVITPVSFADWGNKETQALLPQVPVVPVDVQGLLCLMEILFTENYDITTAIKQYQQSFYKVAPVDFENLTDIEHYCNKAGWANLIEDGKKINILFQWIAALAVYPKIKWEVTLAVGKALLDKYDKTPELNFTNLLRVARIKWMKDGQFPDYTRLDLLKALTTSNEVIARETILKLLKEIPENELPEKHFAYEEKEIQRISNEFILYAYNPVKYKAYEESRKLYEKLYLQNKITDAPSRIYISNERSAWITPIHRTGTAKEAGNISLSDYFKPEEKTGKTQDNIFLFFFRVSLFTFLVSLLGLIALIIVDFLSINKFPVFTYSPPVTKDIRFSLVNNTGVDTNMITLTIDTTDDIRSGLVTLPINDSLKYVSVKFEGSSIYDTALQINYDGYRLVINQATARQLRNEITVKLLLSANCGTSPATFARIIREVNSAIIVEDSLISYITSKTNCGYMVLNGPNVAAATVDSLLKKFAKYGIELNVDMKPENISVQPNQIYIYPSGLSGNGKPLPIFIQYNNRDSVNKARQLMQCLNGNNYSVKGIEYQSGNNYYNRSEIRYFDKRFADSIPGLQSCLKTMYPGKVFVPVFVKGRSRGADLEIWIYDTVIIPTVKNNPDTIKKDLPVQPNNFRTFSSGFKITSDYKSYGRIGLFVKDYGGNVYALCSAPVFPLESSRASSIYEFQDDKTQVPIAKIFRQSTANPLIGLITLINNEGRNALAGQSIKGYRSAAVGQEVFMYDPLEKGEVSTAKGVVTSINYTTRMYIEKTAISLNNVISCTIQMTPGQSGSVLLDKDNYALGILVGGNEKQGIFVSIETILKEFNMELLTTNNK